VLLGRVVEPGEPLWLPADTDGLLALQSDADARCHGCGQVLKESMDPDLAELWDTTTPTCYACAAMDRKKRSLQDGEQPHRHKGDGKKVLPYMDEAVDDGG
jgi:hypothetical protein